MGKPLTRQLVIRVDQELYDRLVADADRYERTVAQTARFHLRAGLVRLEPAQTPPPPPQRPDPVMPEKRDKPWNPTKPLTPNVSHG